MVCERLGYLFLCEVLWLGGQIWLVFDYDRPLASVLYICYYGLLLTPCIVPSFLCLAVDILVLLSFVMVWQHLPQVNGVDWGAWAILCVSPPC